MQKIKRAKIEIECGKKNIVCYFISGKESIIEIDEQEYDGNIEVEHVNEDFNIFIRIYDWVK